MSGVTCQVQVSGVRCQLSDVRCQVSGTRCQVSRVQCQLSDVECQVSGVRCLACAVFGVPEFEYRPGLKLSGDDVFLLRSSVIC